jgi:ABC-type transporter Mla MlaB component
MDAVAADSPPPKLVIEKFADGRIACLKFVGTIDEAFEGKKLGQSATGDVLVIDLGSVKKISSFGIREWVDFVGAASKQVRSLILIECAPKVVDQLNMVANFAGGGRVFSFYVPFRCDYCDSEHRVLLQVDRDHETIKKMKLAERPCPSCNESMYFDEDGATFFSYLIGQERFELEPAVAGFLASKLNYVVSDLNRKLRVDKIIEGRTTYLRLAGDLDRTFPRDKLAEGLEGLVLVDLSSIGRIEPAGAAEWRRFVQMATPLVERLDLAAVPPAFLEKLCGRDDLGAKGSVVTLTLPYTCGPCGTTSQQLIEVGPHHEILKFATAPELRCPQCKHGMQCVAGESLMTILPQLPKLAASSELVKSIGMLRERATAPARRPSERKVALSQPAMPAAARTSLLVPFLAAALAVVLAAGGYLGYQRWGADKPAKATAGTVIDRSAAQRPAWITGDAQSNATCTDTSTGVSCVGVSSLVARQDEAEDEALEIALDAVANAIAIRIVDPAWKRAVLPIYHAAREAKLAAFDRDPASSTARREVREARQAVARALRATSGGAIPPTPARYWEQYDSDGKRYLAFAQLAIAKTELAKLVESYSQPAAALGATVVGAFPLVAWRHPGVERGAIVVALAPGPLKTLGLAEQHVVLSIAGRDVADATSFARLATDEHASLAGRGGTLRLEVQTGDTTPREFALTVPAPAPADPKRPPRNGKGPREPNPTGGVNVWDKFGGNRGSGKATRDNPND